MEATRRQPQMQLSGNTRTVQALGDEVLPKHPFPSHKRDQHGVLFGVQRIGGAMQERNAVKIH